MAFTPKDWKDLPDLTTPLSAAALEDMESRLAAYSDTTASATLSSAQSYAVSQDDAVKSDYEKGFASYRLLAERSFVIRNTESSGNLYVLSRATSFMGGLPVGSSNSQADDSVYLDPTNYAASPRTVKYRIEVTALVNGTGPGVTITTGLYPASTLVGGSAIPGIASTTGLVTGSSVAVASPPATTVTHANGSDFTAPSAGAYFLGFGLSGTPASSATALMVRLVMHQI